MIRKASGVEEGLRRFGGVLLGCVVGLAAAGKGTGRLSPVGRVRFWGDG